MEKIHSKSEAHTGSFKTLFSTLCVIGLVVVGNTLAVAANSPKVDPMNPPVGVRFTADQIYTAPTEPQQAMPQKKSQQQPSDVYIKTLPRAPIPDKYQNPPPGVNIHIVPEGR